MPSPPPAHPTPIHARLASTSSHYPEDSQNFRFSSASNYPSQDSPTPTESRPQGPNDLHSGETDYPFQADSSSPGYDYRAYRGLSASAVPGYQSTPVGMQEDSHPVDAARDSRSTESGSSNGQTGEGALNASSRPITMSSEGSFEVRDRGSSHRTSDGAHFDDTQYSGRQSGIPREVSDGAIFGVGSPTSSFGRFNDNSYGYASGLASGRASTVATDSNSPLHYNSSRTALNNDWRGSQTFDQEIHGISTLNEGEVASGKEGYGPAGTRYGYDAVESSSPGPGAKFYAPLPPSSPAPGEVDEKAGPPHALPTIIVPRANRLQWIDGLRGIASVIIFTHHFSDLTWANTHPEVLQAGSLEGFLKNGQLAIGIYFLLGGRVLAVSFLKSAFTIPKAPVVHGDEKSDAVIVPAKPRGPKWLTLSSSLFRRSIRLAFPAIIVGLIQWLVCINGLVNTAEDAEDQVLLIESLWIPTWCSIGNFAGFLQFCLDLFTERNHQYMLYVGSALWTTYDQFWGSVLVYILAAMMAPLPHRGRYTLYLAIAVSLWFVNSPNLLYVLGLWLADFHASGFVRQIQDSWKLTVFIEVFVMALALAFIAGGTHVASPVDSAIAKFTVYDGKFGWNPALVWPQYMLTSNWVPAACILLWVELSHAMQWFISWGLFTWVGKVSYGFYLMQFLTIYGLAPHLLIYFNNQGKSFWGIIIPTYIICLLFNFFIAWVSYHLLDRIGLKLGKWIWDGLFVTKPNTAGALPVKFVRHLGDVIIHGPSRFFTSVSQGASNSYHGFRTGVHTMINWRSPVTRPPLPDPTDPDILSQLHSTRWTSDLSHDPEAMRTRRLLRLQSWAWLPHLFIIPGLTAIWVVYHPTGTWTWDVLTFSTLWRFIWVLSIPNCLFAWFGFMTPDITRSEQEMSKQPVVREYIRNFFIVLVTKGSNEAAVRRGYNKLIKLEKYHPSIKVVILTDEPYTYPELQNIVCPKSYKSPLGKAKYKARALDYFRFHVSLGSHDWILHMDEESVTDGETIRNCLSFIRHEPHHFAQGIILYNDAETYWTNWYFTVADGIRVGDDLARFHFQNSIVHRPIFGVHGSFLLTNGEMENECTWDFGSLAEDFEFSQDAWRRGFTSGRIHGIVREQSPTTLRDFLKQRRRWFMGIRDIKGLYGLPALAINLWIVGVFTLAVTIVNLPLSFIDSASTPFWVALCADFCFMCFMTIYLWGILFQELDYGQKAWKIPIHLLCSIVIQPFASVAEGLAAIWAMSSEDFGKFEVITKR